MQVHESWPATVQSATQQAREIVAYLLSGAEDPGACTDLARLANDIRTEAAIQEFDELERVAESVATIAAVGVIDSHAAMELDAAFERLLVLADRTVSPSGVGSEC